MARPPDDSIKAPWKRDDPCPCGRNERYVACCLGNDGLPLARPIKLLSNSPRTKKSITRCFLSFTEDCGNRISNEHYISQAILKEFDTIRVSGMIWQNGDESSEVGLNSLTVRALCERHNSALSMLDKIGTHAFISIRNAVNHAKKNSLSRSTNYFLIDGAGLELWALKTLAGAHYGGVFAYEKLATRNQLSPGFARLLDSFTAGHVPEPLGMNVSPSSGHLLNDGIGLAPLVSDRHATVTGISFNFLGVKLDFVFSTLGANPMYFVERRFYRPWIVDLIGPKRTARLVIAWPHQRKHATRVAIEIEETPHTGRP